MITSHCKGLLRHHFWGDYSAQIVLRAESIDHAFGVLDTLGDGWTCKDQHVFWTGTGEQLVAVKATLAEYGADPSKIDSVAKSIDYGEPFTAEIPVAPDYSNQIPLFAGAS